jgi:hypothetical protein
MAELATYVADIKRYASNPNEAAIAGLVKYLGIALRNRDSALVSGTDPKEVARVRDNFLKKKLGLTEPDDKLVASIKAVIEKLKDDRTKSRVTVYYLLADHYRKLDMFDRPAAKAAKPTSKVAARAASGPKSPSKSMAAPKAKKAAKPAAKAKAPAKAVTKPAAAATASKTSAAKKPAAKAAKPAAKKAPAKKAAAAPAKSASKSSKPAAKKK